MCVLIFYFTQRSTGQSHTLYVQESLPVLCRLWVTVFKCRGLYCAFLMENKHKCCVNFSIWY